MKMRRQRGEKRGSHGGSRREKSVAHGEAQEVSWGTWEVTNEEKEGGHMAGGRGEHVKTRCEAHEREPLLSNGPWALVNGDRFIRATIPAFVRFFNLEVLLTIARSPLCAIWVTLLNLY